MSRFFVTNTFSPFFNTKLSLEKTLANKYKRTPIKASNYPFFSLADWLCCCDANTTQPAKATVPANKPERKAPRLPGFI